MQIERDLERALGRKAPPAGFSDRLMARVRADKKGARRSPGSRFAMRAGLAAAVVATAILAAAFVQHQVDEAKRRVDGIRAKEQVMLAMQIASSKTRLAKERALDTQSASSSQNGERP